MTAVNNALSIASLFSASLGPLFSARSSRRVFFGPLFSTRRSQRVVFGALF